MPDAKLSQLTLKPVPANADLVLLTDVAAGQSKSTTVGNILARVSAMDIAAAGGTADVITATYPASLSLTDLTVLKFVALYANMTTNPVFNPNTLGNKKIFKKGGRPLAPGDIAGPGFVAEVEYNSTYDSAAGGWELLNPATNQIPWGVVGGTGDAMTLAAPIPALYDGLCIKFRSVDANTITNPVINVNSLGNKTLYKHGGQALAVGDIPRAGYECIVIYNLANTRWELLNPYFGGLNLAAIQGWTGQQYAVPVTVSSSSGVLALDLRYHALAKITLAESVTSCTISNQIDGACLELIITGAGSYTFSLSASWRMADGSTVSIAPAAGKKTRILAESDGIYMNIYAVIQEA